MADHDLFHMIYSNKYPNDRNYANHHNIADAATRTTKITVTQPRIAKTTIQLDRPRTDPWVFRPTPQFLEVMLAASIIAIYIFRKRKKTE